MPGTPHPTTSESVQPPLGVSGPRVPAGQVERPSSLPPARSGARPYLRGYLIRLLPSLGPGLLMGVIGAVGVTRPVLSWDEVATADVVRRSTGQIWAMIHHVDAAHGTYYFLMHAWTQLVGTSEWDLRLPSIVAMAVAVGLAGELGRRLFSPLVGGLAGLFLCLIPNSSRYAAEARPYAFSCLLSVLALLLLHRALRRPGAARWIGYGLGVVLLGLSHIVALTTLAAHAVAVGYQWRHHRSWRTPAAWAATVLVALSMLVPLFWLVAGQRETAFWPDPITPGRLGAAPVALVGSRPAAWLLVGLALLAAWRPIDRMVEVTALLLAPPAALAVISVLVQPLWVPRYLLVVLAPLALLAAIATVRADPAGPVRLLRILLVLAVVVATVYPGQRAVREPTAKNGADYRGAVRLFQRYGLPADAILYHDRSRTLRAGVDYYQLGAAYRPQDVLLRRSAAQSASLIAEEYPDVATHLAGVQRVWLMVNDHPTDPTVRKPAARGVLRADFQRVALWRISGATIALYQRRG